MRILTFDIEEYFHILDNASTKTAAEWQHFEPRIDENVDRILDFVDRNNQKATFFCLGWVARKHPQVIRRIFEQGHEIGSHSDLHQLAYEQSQSEYVEDLKRSIDALQQITGDKIRLYRAPGFSITEENVWAFEKLVEAGIEVDCSVFPASRAHGGLPQYRVPEPSIIETDAGDLKSFPINTRNIFGRRAIFSGGGYFRLAPQRLLKRWFEDSDYVMTYFHPRDFDPGQPVVKGLSAVRRFKSYVGLAGAMSKLESLVKAMDFCDVASAEAQIDWHNVERIRIS